MQTLPTKTRYPSARILRAGSLTSLLAATLLACGGGVGGPNPPGHAPTVAITSPASDETAVPVNARLAVTFDMAMEPLSSSTFLLKQGATTVAGTVATTHDGATTTFKPASNLSPDAVYTATITTGARSSAGTAMAADRSWSFTTGRTADSSAPTVSSTSPSANSAGVATNAKVIVTFSKPMDPFTLTSSSFTVRQGANAVSGAVVYGPGTIATFTPAAALSSSSAFSVGLATSITDLHGNPLATAFAYSFTTGTVAARGPAPVGLGTAGGFAILAKTGVSSVPASAVTGDIGLGPAAATYLTGFSLVADSTNVFATSTQITGKAFAANYAVPTPSNLTTAVSNMEAAYTDAAGRVTPDFLELLTGNIGGQTLAPGLYKWTSSVTIPNDVTLSGGANDVWIFQTTGDLSMTAAKRVTLAGGALAKNIFWQVAGRATFGANSHFEGVLLSKTDVTLQTGATMNGRILSQTQVALQQATVTQPAL